MEPAGENGRKRKFSWEEFVIFKGQHPLLDSVDAEKRLNEVHKFISKVTSAICNGENVIVNDIERVYIYVCCVSLCSTNPHRNLEYQLMGIFIEHMEYIVELTVLPSLREQTDDVEQRLSVLVLMWNRYKEIVDWFSEILKPLNEAFNAKGVTLKDVSIDIFSSLVCNNMYETFVATTMNMITVERDGQEINGDLLKSTIDFFFEIRSRTDKYFRYFELNLLRESQIYYYWLSWEWINENHESFTSYLAKAEHWMKQEEMRMSDRLPPITMSKLTEAVRIELLDNNARELVELFFGF